VTFVAEETFPTYHSTGLPYGELHPTNCKEQISIAYTHAVVTAARCKLNVHGVDDESVDATIRQMGPHHRLRSVSLDVQLKCTAQDVVKGDSVFWRLSRKNYVDLSSSKRIAPAIIVILTVPHKFDTRVYQDPTQLKLVKCAYWGSIRNGPPLDDGAESRVIHMPERNLFNVEQLLGMMHRIGEGGLP